MVTKNMLVNNCSGQSKKMYSGTLFVMFPCLIGLIKVSGITKKWIQQYPYYVKRKKLRQEANLPQKHIYYHYFFYFSFLTTKIM